MSGVIDGVRRELKLRGREGLLRDLSPFTDDFAVTWVSQRKHFPDQSTFAFILKPELGLRQMFGFDREILLVYSDRPELQARTIQAADTLMEQLPVRGRVETLLYFLLSPASNVFDVVATFAADSRQNRIAVPFMVGESEPVGGLPLVYRRLQEHLFNRDLYDIEQPITNDTFFFGRNQFVVETRDAIKQGSNVGLFGLRKTGKTSLIFKLRRLLEQEGIARLHYFDLQNPGLYGLRWWDLLREICVEIDPTFAKRSFNELEAPRHLLNLAARLKSSGPQHTVVALDEIEHIVPGLTLREHWNQDFLEFWKTIRAVQNTNRHVAFIVAGVNASSVEASTYGSYDNPLFSMVGVRYVPPFGVEEVAEMLGKLGHYMGITYDSDVYEYLCTRYGGHPLLTRLVASKLYQAAALSRSLPCHVDRSFVAQRATQIDRSLFAYAEHVLGMLKTWYKPEYDMLQCLANGEREFFEEMTLSAPQYAEHLKSYGLVRLDPAAISMPFLASYLRSERSVQECSSSTSEQETSMATQLAEIGRLRNELEPRLRTFIRQILMSNLGARHWIDPVLKAIPSERAGKLNGVDAGVILAEHLYLPDLIVVIDKNWTLFKVLETGPKDEQMTREQFKILLHFVNAHREDAHAKAMSATEFATARVAITVLDKALGLYVD